MRGLIIALLLAAAPATAQEVAVPDTPVNVTVKAFAVVGIHIENLPEWRFVVTFTDDQGKRQEDVHIGPSYYVDPVGGGKTANPSGAENLIKQMNTANMSVKSMNKRALEHLISEGKIPPATIQGTPQPPTARELDQPPVVPKTKKLEIEKLGAGGVPEPVEKAKAKPPAVKK